MACVSLFVVFLTMPLNKPLLSKHSKRKIENDTTHADTTKKPRLIEDAETTADTAGSK